MEKNNENMHEQIKRKLQKEAEQFLTKTQLVLKNLIIAPKEIEVYYYKAGVFEDEAVHKHKLQQNNKNHFYVHRCKNSNSYKGGNRAGLDFVVSQNEGVYYSYLIRSAMINGVQIVGPNKVLRKIKEDGNLDNENLEGELVILRSNNNTNDILFSNRINLTKGFIDCELRAVVCDDAFRQSKYPAKENMIVKFLLEKISQHQMAKDDALEYANNKLGYKPSSLK